MLGAALLAPADTVDVYPAHFSGSACGAGTSGSGAIPARPAEMLAVLPFNQGLDG